MSLILKSVSKTRLQSKNILMAFALPAELPLLCEGMGRTRTCDPTLSKSEALFFYGTCLVYFHFVFLFFFQFLWFFIHVALMVS